MSKRRVVVTGLGAVTPVGNNVQAFWESVKTGKIGIGEITRFDTADFKVKLAAEVYDFNANQRKLWQMQELKWKKKILSASG